MNSVYKLLIQITGKDKGAKRELDKTKRSVKGLDNSLKGLKNTMQLAGVAGMAFMAKQAVSTAWELAKLGAESLRMKKSFDDLAQRIGTSGDALLKSVQVAASGTVSEMDIMKTTAGLLASGIQTSTADIVDAMEIAQLKAQQFGITTTEAYNRMVTGARKFSVEMLDEIGINLKAESVYKRRAEAMGVAASALTDAQKAEALWVAILEDGRAELEQYGGATDDLLTDLQRAEVAASELRVEFAERLAPSLVEVTNAARDLIPVLGDLATGPVADLLIDFAGDITQMVSSLVLLTAATEGVISPLDAFNADIEAAKIKNEQGTEAMRGFVAAVIATGGAILETSDAQRDWTMYLDATEQAIEDAGDALTELPGDIAQANTAISGHITVLGKVYSAYQAIAGMPQAVLDLDPRAAEAWEHLQDTRDAAEREWIENSMDRLHGFEDANEETAASVGRTWQDEYDRLRSAVESALSPTVVTSLDMELSELGQYVDKWDENARRLDAVAEAGFAAFDAHPDWIEILKIPDNVLASGEAGLKSWAAQVAASVRDLTRPDLLNIDAAVAAVERYFADMAARELSIDLVTQALIEKGVVSGADAKKQVAQALGLDQTIVGEEAGAEIFDGMIAKFSEKSAASEFAGHLSKDVIAQAVQLRGAGYELWITTEVGILDAMEEGNYVQRWINLLLPALVAAMGTQGQWSGEGEP